MNSSFEKLLGWDKKRDEIRDQLRTGKSPMPAINMGLKNTLIGIAHDSLFTNKWMRPGKKGHDGSYSHSDNEDTGEVLGEISERLDAINRTVEDVFHTQENIEVLAQKILHLKNLSTGNKDSSFPAIGGSSNSDSEKKNDATQTSGGGVLATVGLVVVIKKIYNLIASKGAKWAVTRLIKRYGLARASLFVGKFVASSALTASGIGTALGVAGIAWMVYEAYDILTRDEEDKVDPSVQGTLDIFRDMDKKSADESAKSRTDQAAGLLGKLEKDSLAKAQSDRIGGFASKFPMSMPQEKMIESKHGKIRFKANEIIFESKNIRGLAGGRPSTPGGTASSGPAASGKFNPYSQEHSSDEQSMDSRMREMDGRQAPGGSSGGSVGGSGGYSGGGYSGGGSSGSPSGGGSGGSPSATGVPSPSQPGFQQPQLGRWSAMPKAMVDERAFSIPRVEYAAPSGPGSFAGQPTLAPFLGQGPGPSQDSGFSPEEMPSYGSAFHNYHPEGSAGMTGRGGVPSGVPSAGPRDGTKDTPGAKVSEGGSPYLANLRSIYAKELEADPKLRDTLLALAMKENARDPASVVESLMNRAAANGKTLRNQMFNGFYGPINRGEVGYGSKIGGSRLEKAEQALTSVLGGRNVIDLRTDQGRINEHRFADRYGKRPKAQINGEWYSDKGVKEERWAEKTRREMEAYDRKHREEGGSKEAKEEPPEKAADAKKDERPFIMPVDGGRRSSGYGQRWGRTHHGIDQAVPVGTPVKAAADGKIVTMRNMGGYGLTVEIEHADGSRTRYAHLSKFQGKVGDTVTQGTVVALSGNTGSSTGPHLHFEHRLKDGRSVDPNLSIRTSPLEGVPLSKFKEASDPFSGKAVIKDGGDITSVGQSNKEALKRERVLPTKEQLEEAAKTPVKYRGITAGRGREQDAGEDAKKEDGPKFDEHGEILIDPELEAEEKAEDEKAKIAAEEKRNPSQTPTPWSKKGKERKDYTPVVLEPQQEVVGDGATSKEASAQPQQQEPEKQPERSIVPPAGTMLSDTQPPHKEYNSKEAAPPVVPKGTDRPVKKDIYSESQY